MHVDGALVAFGDAHGVQGDGEITGVAVELEAEVELTMRVRDREEAGFVELPQLDTAEAIGSLAGLHPFYSVLASVERCCLDPAWAGTANARCPGSGARAALAARPSSGETECASECC